MIDIQDYVKPTRTGKAGLRIAQMANLSSVLNITPKEHSARVFTESDVGKTIVVVGAGPDGANLYTTIAGLTNSTEVELAAPASAQVSRATIAWWDASQDDAKAFEDAQNACSPGNGILYCPGDVYIISSTLVAAPDLQSMIGDGAGETFFVCTSSLTGNFLSVPGVPSWFSLGGAPTQGFTVLGPGYQTPATITAWSIASNVATFTANNDFTVGQQLLLQGFMGGPVNNILVTVLAPGLSNTQFSAGLEAPDASAVDTGVASLNWNGIAFTSSGADWIALGNIEVQAFAGDAVQINDTIVSTFRRVIMSHCGQGFNDLPSPTEGGGTSLNFDTCFASDNYKAGYYVRSLAYSSFNNCAADGNGVGYYLDGAKSVSFNGSGSEGQHYHNAAYPGYSYYFHGAKQCALNCPYATSRNDSDTRSTHLVFDNDASGVFVNCFKANAEKLPTLPTNVFTIDKTCSSITIWEPDFGPSGAVAWIDNGTNDTVYLRGQFHTPIRGAAGAEISGNVSCDTAIVLPTPTYANSSAVTPSHFLPLPAGWGDGASFNFASGNFAMGSFQIKANGKGLTPNPTVTFTFPEREKRDHNPNIVWSRFDGSIAQPGYWLVSAISPAQITWVFVGTPVAGQNIGLQWIASSRG